MRSSRTPARSRGRRVGLVPYLAAAVVLVYFVASGAALLWGGGEAPPGGSRNAGDGAGSAAAGAREPAEAARPEGEGGVRRDTAEGGGVASPEEPADEGYEEVDRAEGGEGRAEDGASGTRLPRGSSGGGEAPYDPLGTGAGVGTLSETDLSRARLAAFRFVDAAYDFRGSGPAARLEYLEEVNRTVDAPEFWKSPESPGSGPVELVARTTAEYGVENAALFRSFRVEETSSERVIGTATFALDEGSGEKTYEQRLVLSRWAAVWRVLYAKPLEEVS